MNRWNLRPAWCAIAAASLAVVIAAGSCAAQLASTDDPAPYDPAPQRLVWPGVAVIIVIAIFVTAALAGPLIRANADHSSESAAPSQENAD